MGSSEANREIDLFTAPAFAATMRVMVDWADDRTVFIDCSAITFMDSNAFYAFVYANRYAAEHGHVLVIRNLRPNCARAIRLCDRDHELTIDSSSQIERCQVARARRVRDTGRRELVFAVFESKVPSSPLSRGGGSTGGTRPRPHRAYLPEPPDRQVGN